jgi:hypothetical protein
VRQRKKKIKRALEDLLKGSNALDSAYNKTKERIEGQQPSIRELAKQALLWITCAKRTQIALELRHAVAVEIGESELNEENLPEIEDIVSECAGLVTVDKKSDIIRLVHYTTQEYLQTHMFWLNPQKDPAMLQNNDAAMADAQKYITIICVTYLLLDNFETGFCTTDDEFEERLESNILYDSAAHSWGHHALAASTEVELLILDFLKSEAKLSTSNQAMMAWGSYSGYSQSIQRQMTGVHVATRFGLTEAIVALLKSGHDLNLMDS